MTKMKKLFLDDDGNPSSMRFMSAIAFFASAYLALYEVFGEVTEEVSNTELVIYFLAAAFLPKSLQKFAEGASASDEPVVENTKNKKGWFTDQNGNPSSVRYMALGALLMAIVLAVGEVHGWGSGQEKNELVLYFLAAAFVPKAIQKFAESNKVQ